MKFRGFLISCLTLGFAASSFAQAEYDDMYFNARDRSELNALKSSGALAMTSRKKSMLDEELSQNPTDSYSARNVNPEHVSRSNARAAQEDEQDYFISNYNQKTASSYSNWNNGLTTGTTTPGIRQAGTVPRSVRGTALTTALFIPIMVPRFRSTITGVHPGMTRSIVRCTVMVPVPIGAVLPGMSDWAIRSAVCTARFQCARGDLPADTDGTIAGILAQPLS
jgi:hypothetical protein